MLGSDASEDPSTAKPPRLMTTEMSSGTSRARCSRDCNELAVVNDYRDDLDHFYDVAKQSRCANVAWLEVIIEQRPYLIFVCICDMKR